MLKTHKLCSVCAEIKKDRHLAERIYNTKHYLKNAGISLLELYESQKEKKYSYTSLLNHVKKHQFMDEDSYNEAHLRKIAKNAEKSILKREITSKQVWDDVIKRGAELLENGELEVNTGHLLKAAKDKSDYELKRTDQQLAIAEMVFHFASGESDLGESRKYEKAFVSTGDPQVYDATLIGGDDVNRGLTGAESEQNLHPTDESAGSAEERRDRSRAFYQRIIGSTPASGTD